MRIHSFSYSDPLFEAKQIVRFTTRLRLQLSMLRGYRHAQSYFVLGSGATQDARAPISVAWWA